MQREGSLPEAIPEDPVVGCGTLPLKHTLVCGCFVQLRLTR